MPAAGEQVGYDSAALAQDTGAVIDFQATLGVEQARLDAAD